MFSESSWLMACWLYSICVKVWVVYFKDGTIIKYVSVGVLPLTRALFYGVYDKFIGYCVSNYGSFPVKKITVFFLDNLWMW